jgi:lytic murein transglycosylase
MALFRACVVALVSSFLTFPESAVAKMRSVHPRRPPFQEFVASLWPLAEERGISRATFDAAFVGVSFDWKVVANTTRQAEFVRPIWQYVASAVSPPRIGRGREKAQAAGAWLAKATQTYGVDRGVILGIWGLETDYGGFTGTDGVVKALASLAFVHFRGDYFRDELLSALVILQEADIAPGEMRGSWAGAMGQMQFMPSSFLLYAVDFENHGRRDIWKSVPDAIGSTANFLAAHGWWPDLPWGFEVRLPAEFALTEADSSRPAVFAAFAARGVKRADGAPLPRSGEGRLLIPAGLKGPIFLVTRNFDIIRMYNNSTSYALAVALLGDAVTGGKSLFSRWPVGDRPLVAAQVRRLQAKLRKMGYDVGEIDGKVGEALRSAVRAYQERNGLSPDGYANLALLKRVDARQ